MIGACNCADHMRWCVHVCTRLCAGMCNFAQAYAILHRHIQFFADTSDFTVLKIACPHRITQVHMILCRIVQFFVATAHDFCRRVRFFSYTSQTLIFHKPLVIPKSPIFCKRPFLVTPPFHNPKFFTSRPIFQFPIFTSSQYFTSTLYFASPNFWHSHMVTCLMHY